jgi:putative transposase
MRYRRVLISGASYFFTFVTYRRTALFSDPIEIERYRRAVQKVQGERPFALEAEVILPDHIHTLWTLPEGDADYPTRVRLIKAAFTRASVRQGINRSESRSSKREQGVWQRRYWEHTIRDERDFQVHLDYIHINPVKHGLVAAASDWPYSTFREWVERGVYEAEWGSGEMPPLPEWVGHE